MMHRVKTRRQAVRGLAAAWLATGSLLVPGPGSATPPAEATALAEEMQRWLHGQLQWPAELQADAGIRPGADAIRRELLARAETAWPSWVTQVRQAFPDEPITQRQVLMFRAWNEFAMWWVDSAGAAHDQAWLRLATQAWRCQSLWPMPLQRRLGLIATAAAADRATLLEGERVLASRWGTLRRAVPPRPTDLDAAEQAILQQRAGMPQKTEPMVPFLAQAVLDSQWRPGQAKRWEQCARSQWWLSSQLAAGSPPAQALTAYRYATLPTLRDWLNDPTVLRDLEVQPDGGYPPLVARIGLEGTVRVLVDTDEAGRFQRARVLSRRLGVPGMGEDPPVAFEALLDASSLAQAARQSYPANGRTRREIELVWRLSPTASNPP
jgi:hypothetical protein